MMDLEAIKAANANPKEFARQRLSDAQKAREDNEARRKRREQEAESTGTLATSTTLMLATAAALGACIS